MKNTSIKFTGILALLMLTISFASTNVTLAETVPANLHRIFSTTLKKGQEDTTIQELQHILKSDPTIYPEGLTTGYYGSLTEQAVMRLQRRYNLAETGIVDTNLQHILFPRGNVTLNAPNGGETWNKSFRQFIGWKWTIADSSVSSDYGFFARGSIELVRDSNPLFRYYIGTARLTDEGYSWSIPEGILNGDDYRIRLSVGSATPCLYKLERDIAVEDSKRFSPPCISKPPYLTSDTSDETFEITGNITAPPNNLIIAKLKDQADDVEKALLVLVDEIRELRQLLNEL